MIAVLLLSAVCGYCVFQAASSPTPRSPNRLDRWLPAAWADPVHGVSLRFECAGWGVHVHHWIVLLIIAGGVWATVGAGTTPSAW